MYWLLKLPNIGLYIYTVFQGIDVSSMSLQITSNDAAEIFRDVTEFDVESS